MSFFKLEQSWEEVLKCESKKPYFTALKNFIEEEYKYSPVPIYPPQDQIFNAFDQTPFDQVKVLIIGQDPYHNPGQAHGLSFSVPRGIALPPSLKNIFKELKNDLGIPPSEHGSLISWAKQGVMLLNATLTVRENAPLSHHKKGWEQWTDAVVESLAQRESPVVFVLWGKSAQEKCHFLNDLSGATSHHLVLTAAHPSPFSAHRGFFGCRHFSQINAFLEKTTQSPIEWMLR